MLLLSEKQQKIESLYFIQELVKNWNNDMQHFVMMSAKES